jgi:hypothetical protein
MTKEVKNDTDFRLQFDLQGHGAGAPQAVGCAA